MSERSKIRWSQLKVGVVAFAAMVVLAVLIFLLTGTRNIFEGNETRPHLHGGRRRHDREYAGAAERYYWSARLGGSSCRVQRTPNGLWSSN